MSKAKTAKQVLQAARQILSNNEWIQHRHHSYNFVNKQNSYCVMGAINVVNADDVSVVRAVRRFRSVIGLDIITVWNDEAGRTKEDVLAALDKAIELEDK